MDKDDGDQLVMIYSTFPDPATAESVGKALVENNLAGCVNILPQMTSLYRWEGKLNRDDESVMLIKTRASLASRAVKEVEARHPYDTPAVLVIGVADGARGYISWLLQQTART